MRNGKGSVGRPKSVDEQTYTENHERTFGKSRRLGRIYGTCGHDITERYEAGIGTSVSVARLDREGRRVISYETVCIDCKSDMQGANVLLQSVEEEDAWLCGTLERNAW